MNKILLLVTALFALHSQATANKESTPTLAATDLKYFQKLFEQNKLASFMECEIKVRNSQDIRKFKDRSEWIETLEINYRPYRYDDGLEETIVINPGAQFVQKIRPNLKLGRIEEFRINLNDSKSSFIEFSHDGKGNITGFLFGDIYRIYPCREKNY